MTIGGISQGKNTNDGTLWRHDRQHSAVQTPASVLAVPSSPISRLDSAWLPTSKSPTGGTFVEILEIQGRTKLGGDFVHEAIDQFAAIKEGRANLPPSTVRCGFGLDATP